MKKFLLSWCALVLMSAVSFADTYIVTGGNGTLFGSTWDPNSSCVLVEQSDGSLVYTKADVTLSAGDIEYKYLTKEAGWNGWQLPKDGNKKLNIPKAGRYDITFTLSADKSADNVNAVFKEEVTVVPAIQLHSNIKEANWSSLDFVWNADNTVASLTVSEVQGAKTYEFGLKFDGAWKANGAVITKENNTTNLSSGDGNMKLESAATGDYVFTYTLATQELAVTFPEGETPQPTLPAVALMGIDGDWNTGKEFTPAENKETTTVVVTLAAQTYEFKVKVDNSWLGNYGEMTRENCTGWVFEDTGLTNAKIVADMAGDYTFTWTYATKALSVTYPSITTIVDAIDAESQVAIKVVRNGQVLIIRDGVAYDMMGQVQE